MAPGARWQIRLGRRLVLEPDDADGSIFIEDFLEETIRSPHRWKTYEWKAGVNKTWITRPRRSNREQEAEIYYHSRKEDEEEEDDEDEDEDEDEESKEGSTPPSRAPVADVVKPDSGSPPITFEDEYEFDQLAEEDPDAQFSWNPATGFRIHAVDSASLPQAEVENLVPEDAVMADEEPVGNVNWSDDDIRSDYHSDDDAMAGSDWDSDEVDSLFGF